MRAIFKEGQLILVTETDAEREAFAAWRPDRKDHVFWFDGGSERGCALHDLGPREDACREPINVTFESRDERWLPISNLALTPFEMRGRRYASIEGFWQGLKFAGDADRERIAALHGPEAKSAAHGQPKCDSFVFDGQACASGGPAHHGLMLQACRAKFAQHAGAREALLASGDRPLIHRVRRDSKTIPGALMADIWMRIRAKMRRTEIEEEETPEAADGAATRFSQITTKSD
jgi:predicted NAD-dependent protein-ADP-ribosyltransferase YbiA (DUF1768 family)